MRLYLSILVILLGIALLSEAKTKEEKEAAKKAKLKAKEAKKNGATTKKPAAKKKPVKKTTPVPQLAVKRDPAPKFKGFKGVKMYLYSRLPDIRPLPANLRLEELHIKQLLIKSFGGVLTDVPTVSLDNSLKHIEIVASDEIMDKFQAALQTGSFHLSTQTGSPIIASPTDVHFFKPDGFQEIPLTVGQLKGVQSSARKLAFEGQHLKKQIVTQIKVPAKRIQHVVVYPNRQEIAILADRSLAQFLIREMHSSDFYLTSTAGYGIDILEMPSKPIEVRDSTVQRLKAMKLHYSTTVDCHGGKCGVTVKPTISKAQEAKLRRLRKNTIRAIANEISDEIDNTQAGREVLSLLRQIG